MKDRYIIGLSLKNGKTAGNKAQEDINAISINRGYKRVIFHIKKRELPNKLEALLFKFKLSNIKNDAIVVYQYPSREEDLVISFFKKISNINLVLFVHDVSFLRDVGEQKKIEIEREILLFDIAKYIVVHNDLMKKAFIDFGVDENKIISLDMFDYLTDSQTVEKESKKMCVAIAGNLSKDKCGYIYKLSEIKDIQFKLYGINYSDNKSKNIQYCGAFAPGELNNKIDAGFGLAWDGNELDTCSGSYGHYLKYNNPHKISLYLASYMPVIVWKKSAVSNFVLKNGVGIAVDSIREISDILKNLDNETYIKMKNNTKKIGDKLMKGFYTDKVFSEIERRIKNEV